MSEGDSGTGAEDGDQSDCRSTVGRPTFQPIVRGSEASDDWLESRSRVTTPESSTPSSPRRRTGVDDPKSRRPSDLTMSAPPGNRPHPYGGRLRAAPGHRQSSLPIQELKDPAALESRSSHWSHNCRNLSKRGSRRYRPQSTNLSYERTVQLLGEQKQEGAADTDSRLPNTSDLRLPNRAG